MVLKKNQLVKKKKKKSISTVLVATVSHCPEDVYMVTHIGVTVVLYPPYPPKKFALKKSVGVLVMKWVHESKTLHS